MDTKLKHHRPSDEVVTAAAAAAGIDVCGCNRRDNDI